MSPSTQPPLPSPKQVSLSWPCSLPSRTDEDSLVALLNMQALSFPFALGVWSTEPFAHSRVTSAEDRPRLSPQGPWASPFQEANLTFLPRGPENICPSCHEPSQCCVQFCEGRTTVVLMGDSGEERPGSHRGPNKRCFTQGPSV